MLSRHCPETLLPPGSHLSSRRHDRARAGRGAPETRRCRGTDWHLPGAPRGPHTGAHRPLLLHAAQRRGHRVVRARSSTLTAAPATAALECRHPDPPAVNEGHTSDAVNSDMGEHSKATGVHTQAHARTRRTPLIMLSEKSHTQEYRAASFHF